MDRVVAGALLVVCFPVLAVAAAAILLEDRQRPWLRVRRVGRCGRAFDMPKLRTMRVRADVGSPLTAPGDDRVTRVGRHLRRLYLDELPQLLSVVRGDMALIGPRPEDPDLVDLSDPRWSDVLAVRPGIAGVTQVVYEPYERRVLAAADDPTGAYLGQVLPLKLELDRWYVREATPITDVLVGWALVERILLGRPETALERHLRGCGAPAGPVDASV